jgi:CheY-like chemotaxis protein
LFLIRNGETKPASGLEKFIPPTPRPDFALGNSSAPDGRDVSRNGGDPTVARVLVVDDVATNRRIGELLLGRIGCRVSTAPDADSAVRAARESEWDLVFTDMQMPEVGGIELLPMLRAADAECHADRKHRLWVIALSAGELGWTREDFLRAGFDELVEKPIDLNVLQNVLGRWRTELGCPPGADKSEE